MKTLTSDGYVESGFSVDSNERPVAQIVIVGCGPRGFQVLERLSALAEHFGRTHVTIFVPASFPGAGCVYDPRQPEFLRMNFAARHIDAWCAEPDRRSDSLSLVEWLNANGNRVAGDEFVPRASVG